MERRDVMGGALAAGLTAMMAPAPAAAAQAGDDEVSREVRELRRTIETNFTRPWTSIARIREAQRIWLRANHRYPDFIEIGVDVWDALYDWHVRFQQPLSMNRMTDGRYVIAFMFTTFVLRPEQDPDYVGPPYDDRRPVQ
jgi:hypothetical protein